MNQLVFLGGMGRSGTNLLRNMLDCHPKVAAGPEFNFIEDIVWLYRNLLSSVGKGRVAAYLTEQELTKRVNLFLGGILKDYGTRRGKTIVVEKTPSNLWSFAELAVLFPDAKFIHVIRDGRDVACSHREVGKRMVRAGMMLDSVKDSALVSLFHCAALWSETIRFGMRISGPESPLHESGRIITIKYEDLVEHPESKMILICKHLGIEFDERMLHPEKIKHDAFVDELWVQQRDQDSPISTASIGRWRQSLSLKERVMFTAKGQEGLIAAGYETSAAWTFAGLNLTAEEAKSQIEAAKLETEIYSLQSRAMTNVRPIT